MDVNAECCGDACGLLIAAHFGFTEILEILLQQPGIEVNKINSNGETALMMACVRRLAEIVHELISYPGIKRNTVDRKG